MSYLDKALLLDPHRVPLARPPAHTPGGLVLGRCNPYGAESGGPKRLLGGLYGPGSARTPDMGLPANVEQGEWLCEQPAQVRCRMTCECEHQGQVMELCSWRDEETYRGEMVAGAFRQLKMTVRQRGHFEEIQRRQSGSCPRCLFPGEFAALQKDTERLAYELALEFAAGRWEGPRAKEIRAKAETIGQRFDARRAITCTRCKIPVFVWDAGSECGSHRPVDLATSIHNCPLTLKAVS